MKNYSVTTVFHQIKNQLPLHGKKDWSSISFHWHSPEHHHWRGQTLNPCTQENHCSDFVQHRSSITTTKVVQSTTGVATSSGSLSVVAKSNLALPLSNKEMKHAFYHGIIADCNAKKRIKLLKPTLRVIANLQQCWNN